VWMPNRPFRTLLGAIAALSFLMASLGAFAQEATPGVGAPKDGRAAAATCEPNTGRNCARIRGHCEMECTIVSDPKGCLRTCEGSFQECRRAGC